MPEPSPISPEVEIGDVPAALPPVWIYLIPCAIVALWVDFGTLHRDQHSDSILNILISLYRWTPFVWEQDRFGMAVPLLASPIKNPLGNLLAQGFLSTFAGLATFFLLARYAFRIVAYPIVATIGAASFLALTPHYYRFEYLIDTSYGIGLALALWGLILVEPTPQGGSWPRQIAALTLMAVAHWVNSATGLFLGPFVLFRGLMDLDPRSRWLGPFLEQSDPLPDRLKSVARFLWRTETGRALFVLGVGYASGRLMVAMSKYQPTDLAALPAREWPQAWWRLLQVSGNAMKPPFWAAAMALEALIGLAAIVRSRRSPVGRSAVALLATAIVLGLLMGTRSWVKINDYEFRYLLPSILLLQTAVAGLAVASFPSRPKSRGFLPAVAALLMLAAGTWSYGLPSISGVRRDLDLKCGAMTDDLLAARCTCLAGNYWKVWIAVYHANLELHERGDPQIFWGLSFRASPTFELWKDSPMDQRLAAVSIDDGQGEGWLRSYQFPKLKEVEVRRTIRVFKPIPRVRDAH